MIIIIQQSDLEDKTFPIDKLSEAFKISKLFFTEIAEDKFILAKSIYAEQGQTVNKQTVVDFVNKSL